MMPDAAAKHLAPISYALEKTKTLSTTNLVEQLSSSDVSVRGVHIRALSSNSGNIFIGFGNLESGNGSIKLAADEAVYISVDNLKKINLYADSGGDGIAYTEVLQ